MFISKNGICRSFQRCLYLRFAIVYFIVVIASGAVQGYNHPEIKWRSVTTRHFVLHFYDKTEPALYAAWKIAEEAYGVLGGLYGHRDESLIHIALADYDDYSNGFANWTNGSIMVWIPDARYDLRSSNTWLRNVIVHELAHIMSMEKRSKMQLIDWTVALQYTSPNINLMYGEPFAFTSFFPQWFAEGTAQAGTEHLGADCWDSRRDMLLRCAILGNTVLSLDEMGHFTHDIIGNEMVYNQGYSLVKYLEAILGKEKLAHIWNDTRGVKAFGLDMRRYMQKEFNVSLDDVYQAWKDSLKTYYAANKPQQQTQITPVWQNGKINQKPKISSDGRFWGWLTNHKDDFYRTDLVIAKNGTTELVCRIHYAKTDWDFSPDGNSVYYIKSRSPDRNGAYLNDIFRCDIGSQKETRLTRAARIYALNAAPGGKELACVQYEEGVFSLVKFSLDTRKFSTMVEGVAGEPFLSVSFLPSDRRKLVVSKIVNGKAGLFVADDSTRQLNPLINTEAHEDDPFCADDGRIYFSADFDGTFNIYSLRADGSDLQRHTSATGGVFCPAVYKNGKMLASLYTQSGFQIAFIERDNAPYTLPNARACVFEPLPQPSGKVTVKSTPYEPKLLRPVWEIMTAVTCTDYDRALQDMVRGATLDSAWQIDLEASTQITMSKTDAIGKKEMYLGGALVLKAFWQRDDDSAAINKANNDFKPDDDVYRAYTAAQPGFLRREYRKTQAIRSDAFIHELRYTRLLPGSRDSSDTAEESVSRIIPLLVPFLGFENRVFKPTFGMDALMIVYIMPQIINLNPYIEWHVARDLYMGVSPTFTVIPLAFGSKSEKPLGISAPLWLRWHYQRYINEDIRYNNAGISSLSIFAGPEVMPYTKIEDAYDSTGSVVVSDTTRDYVTSLVFGVEFLHAFPVYKYSSFNIRTQNTGVTLNREISGRVGEIKSVDYRFLLTSKTRLGYTFPILRNINRGRWYADNLYGSLFYRLDFSGTQQFFANAERDIVFNKQYSSDYAYLSHRIGAGVELGLIKKYMFMRTLMLEAAWNVFDNSVYVDVSMWF